MPGGVSAGGRYHAALGRPVHFARGAGARLWDVDGRELVDYSSSSGASLLGHGHPAVSAAAARGIELGTLCTYETPHHVELAERICAIVPGVEAVRLVNTGTEATMAALRIARARTGRTLVLKFDGHFHGMHEGVLFNAHAPTAAPGPFVPASADSRGVPQAFGDTLVTVPFNDAQALEAAFAVHGDRLAAAIVEPVSYNQGCIPSDRAWLARLRELTRAHGAALIFDEVLSGFRMAPGGAQERYGITADLVTLAKALGAGWPIAAVGGSQEWMAVLAPGQGTALSGTYSGHLPAVLASLAALELLADPDFHEELDRRARLLCDGMRDRFAAVGVPVTIQQVGARFGIYFGVSEPVVDYRTATLADGETARRFVLAAYEQGLYFHDFGGRRVPMHYGITAAHDDAVISHSLDRLTVVAEALAGKEER